MSPFPEKNVLQRVAFIFYFFLMKIISIPFVVSLFLMTFGSVHAMNNEPVACTMEYAPVCAKVEVQCVRAPCYPIYKTYSNRCEMNAERNTKEVHDDVCATNEEGGPVVLSEKLKENLTKQMTAFEKMLEKFEKKIQLTKFQSLASRIKDRLLIERKYPLTLEQEMRADTIKYALQFLGDRTQTSIWNLEEQLTGKRYLFRDTEKCSLVRIKCMDGESFFNDEIGCGCKK